MKKIKLFSALALTVVMASCDNFDLPNPPGQTNTDPEAYFENTDLAIAPVTGAISLTAANEANEQVTVGTITSLANFPQDYTLEVEMTVGSDDNFSKTTSISTAIDGDAITVNPDVLNGAIQSVITKAPGTYDVNTRLAAYAVKGNTRVRLGGTDYNYCQEKLNIKTYEAAKVIEDAYYLVPCSADGTPNMSAAIQMNNTAGAGVSAYDNPEFAVKVESPETTGYYFKIAPQSAISAGSAATLYGANPAEGGLSGKLGTDYAVGHISIAGDVLVTINMELDSYTVNYAFEVLYPLYGTMTAAKAMLLYTDNYINYTGVCEINNQFMLYTQADKQGVKFGVDPENEPVISEDDLNATGVISNASGTQIKTPVRGKLLYWADINLVQLTYNITAIQTLSVIGAANGWSNDADKVVDLKSSSDHKIWKATDVKVGPEFKINANHAWDIDFGGTAAGTDDAGNLVYNITMKGGNMEVAEGTYDVEVNFTTKPYVLTLKKKN